MPKRRFDRSIGTAKEATAIPPSGIATTMNSHSSATRPRNNNNNNGNSNSSSSSSDRTETPNEYDDVVVVPEQDNARTHQSTVTLASLSQSSSNAPSLAASEDTSESECSTGSMDSFRKEPQPKRVRSEGNLQDIACEDDGDSNVSDTASQVPIMWRRTVVPANDGSGVLQILEQDPEDGLPLPDPADNMNPTDFLIRLVQLKWDTTLETKKAFDLEGFFVPSTDEQVAAYTTEVVGAVRNNDLDELKRLHANGQRVDCYNRFGESLLNMACRRGFNDIVEYLLEQPNVALRSRDDCGRTPLHDACWNPSPLLDICKWIIQREPALFLIADKRGFTPFMYARPQHYGIWRQFLFDNRHYLKVLSYQEMKPVLAAAAQ